MDTFTQNAALLLKDLVAEVVVIFLNGGILMIPLVLIAAFIYGSAFNLYFYFSRHRFYKTSRTRWFGYVETPETAPFEIKSIITYATENVKNTLEIRNRFSEIRNVYLAFPDRRHRFLGILISCAPLMGLLGTVTGMLTTFRGLSVSRGGETVDLIANGIHEALITTQSGLIIAIPAYVLAYLIEKRRNEMDSCLTSLETITVQNFEKKNKKELSA